MDHCITEDFQKKISAVENDAYRAMLKLTRLDCQHIGPILANARVTTTMLERIKAQAEGQFTKMATATATEPEPNLFRNLVFTAPVKKARGRAPMSLKTQIMKRLNCSDDEDLKSSMEATTAEELGNRIAVGGEGPTV